MTDMQELLDQLRLPFHPSMVEWKPGAIKGERALAMPYADLRAYMNRLDEVCGSEWSVAYEPWGNDRIICQLTICGITRSSTGETTNESEKNEIGGTVAESQAFKRASAMFGLGRYLYTLPSGWVDYDAKTKQFTAQAKSKLTGILTQHYRRAMEGRSVSDKVLSDGVAAQEPRDDDNGQANATDPTGDELAIIKQWANRTEAEMWAVMVGACENEYEAANSMNKSIGRCGGKVTKDNYLCVYVDFYRRQQEKLAHEQQQAA